MGYKADTMKREAQVESEAPTAHMRCVLNHRGDLVQTSPGSRGGEARKRMRYPLRKT